MIPVNGKSGMPIGDGVVWTREAIQYEEDPNGIDENTKSSNHQQKLGNSIENVIASRDIISPRKEGLSNKESYDTQGSIKANLYTTHDSST